MLCGFLYGCNLLFNVLLLFIWALCRLGYRFGSSGLLVGRWTGMDGLSGPITSFVASFNIL